MISGRVTWVQRWFHAGREATIGVDDHHIGDDDGVGSTVSTSPSASAADLLWARVDSQLVTQSCRDGGRDPKRHEVGGRVRIDGLRSVSLIALAMR
jgi:hypothetical protein